MDFVDEQVVADEQGGLHGFRGDLERLHDKGDRENCDHYRRDQRLQGSEPGISLGCTRGNKWLRCRLLSGRLGNHGHSAWPWTRGCERRCLSACSAASCSACFL